MEIHYKNIKDFDNYLISNFGNVKNKKTNIILKQRINSNGYYIIDLYKNGIRKTNKIHRLIAEAFIANPENKHCVDHIDNNKLNNDISNLRWATIHENQHNRKINLNNTSGSKGVYFDKTNQKWIARITLDGIKIHTKFLEYIPMNVKKLKKYKE